MIAANGVTARYLEEKGFPSLRRVLRSPGALGRIVELAATTGEHLPSEPSGQALEEFLQEAPARPIPVRFPDVSLSVVKLLGRGEYVLERPGRASGRAFRAGRERLHAFDRTKPPLSRPHHAAPAESRDGGTVHAVRSDELGGLARHCTEQEDNARRSSDGSGSPPLRCCSGVEDRRTVRSHRDRGFREGDVGPHRSIRRPRARSSTDTKGSMWAIAPRRARSTPTSSVASSTSSGWRSRESVP